MRRTVWIEVIPHYPGSWADEPWGMSIGRRWKRRPRSGTMTAGALVVEVELEVPASRFSNVVRAVMDPADATVTVRS